MQARSAPLRGPGLLRRSRIFRCAILCSQCHNPSNYCLEPRKTMPTDRRVNAGRRSEPLRLLAARIYLTPPPRSPSNTAFTTGYGLQELAAARCKRTLCQFATAAAGVCGSLGSAPFEEMVLSGWCRLVRLAFDPCVLVLEDSLLPRYHFRAYYLWLVGPWQGGCSPPLSQSPEAEEMVWGSASARLEYVRPAPLAGSAISMLYAGRAGFCR